MIKATTAVFIHACEGIAFVGSLVLVWRRDAICVAPSCEVQYVMLSCSMVSPLPAWLPAPPAGPGSWADRWEAGEVLPQPQGEDGGGCISCWTGLQVPVAAEIPETPLGCGSQNTALVPRSWRESLWEKVLDQGKGRGSFTHYVFLGSSIFLCRI